jgi:preprotein translocase subunit SecG
MTIVLTIIHVIVCLFLVVVVLLQSGKAADLAGAFGGMGSQTAFGPRGAATVLSKATTIAAGLFMVTSLSLAILATNNAGRGSSVLERQGPAAQKGTTPAQQQPVPAPGNAQPPASTPAAPQQAAPGAAGQPYVEFTDEKTGKVVGREPLDLDKAQRVDPKNANTPAPSQSVPAKK